MEKKKTSSAAKNKYNKKAYDMISLVVPKGKKAIIAEYANQLGLSVNGFINKAIDVAMQQNEKDGN